LQITNLSWIAVQSGTFVEGYFGVQALVLQVSILDLTSVTDNW
jgi:hypothetical protein